ncbi:MAG TPA: hypothetical protein VEB64_18965 [Azospirillaceae bacterium]|nr:hypothetical protein [Azospirillaceae bacterium]
MRRILIVGCAVALGAVLTGPAGAQNANRTVGPNTAPGGDVQQLLGELQDLIRQADRQRAADPRFIESLNNLVQRYEWQWPVAVLREEFNDGDFTRNPTWTVTSGDFWIDGENLRTTVPVPRNQGFSTGAQDQTSQVIGSVLQEVLRQSAGGQSGGGGQTVAGNRAEIFVPQSFANAFAIQMTLASRGDAGRLEFGPYQTDGRDIGYRLVYSIDDPAGLQLLRVMESTGGVVEMVNRDLKLNDGRDHQLQWTRDREGNMVVMVDGQTVMQTLDRGIQQPFQGFTIVNHGGEYGIDRVAINAAESLQARR